MHVSIVTRTKHHVDGVNVGQNEHNYDLSRHSKEHVHVVHPLSEDRLSSCLGDNVIKQLPYHIGVEVGRLRVFNGFCGVANWPVRVGGNLLNSTLAKGVNLFESHSKSTVLTLQGTHSEIFMRLSGIEPVSKLSLTFKIGTFSDRTTGDSVA